MKTFIAIHTHKHGQSVFAFRSPVEHAVLLDIDQVVEVLDIDYEPDKEEYIDLLPLDPPEDLVIVPRRRLHVATGEKA